MLNIVFVVINVYSIPGERLAMSKREEKYEQTDCRLDAETPQSIERNIIYAPNSPIKNTLQLARKIALSPSPVLITGSTGVGKENLARYIHEAGAHAEAPFIDINCGAVPENLFESELFGHAKGAFTGAASDRKGYMESAGEGTLFLDEIGEMPTSLQPKLLRALETRMFRPVGSTLLRPFKGRIIAATHRDLVSLSQKGRFREDLFYRLAVFSLEIPDLAHRKDDIPVLVEHFSSLHKKSLSFTEEAMESLKEYDWPGNIRELRNLIDRLSILTDVSIIDKHTLNKFFSYTPSQKRSSLGICIDTILDMPREGDTLALVEQLLISGALERSGGNKTEAARLLGTSRKCVERRVVKMKNASQNAQKSVHEANSAMKRGEFKAAMTLLEACLAENAISNEVLQNESLLCQIHYLLSICYQRTLGWMSADGLKYCKRAATLARNTGNEKIIQSTMFMVWTSLLMSLDLNKARNAASELFLHAKEKGDEIFIQEGYIARANTLFWIGDCKEAIRVLTESGLLASADDAYATLHQIDLQSLGIMFYGLSCFQCGFFADARNALDRLLARSANVDLGGQDRCFVLQGICWLGCLFEEWELMGKAARELKETAGDHTYSFFIGIGKFFHGKYLFEQGRVAEAEEEMVTGYERYVLYEGGLLFQSFQAWQRGELLLSQGRVSECILFISSSIDISIRHQERVYLVELMELRARAQLALGDKNAAKPGFESALSTACVLCTIPARIRAAAQLLRTYGFTSGLFDLSDMLESLGSEAATLPASLKKDIALLQHSSFSKDSVADGKALLQRVPEEV